jgi:hypothetical protein
MFRSWTCTLRHRGGQLIRPYASVLGTVRALHALRATTSCEKGCESPRPRSKSVPHWLPSKHCSAAAKCFGCADVSVKEPYIHREKEVILTFHYHQSPGGQPSAHYPSSPHHPPLACPAYSPPPKASTKRRDTASKHCSRAEQQEA